MRPDQATREPMTLGNMRQNGVHRLLVYCNGLRCWHSATVDADFLAGDVVLKSLEQRMVCSQCGLIGADVRPNWSDRPERETMVGPNFRS
jgi:hypothetical protein